jgi:hypothetical protein
MLTDNLQLSEIAKGITAIATMHIKVLNAQCNIRFTLLSLCKNAEVKHILLKNKWSVIWSFNQELFPNATMASVSVIQISINNILQIRAECIVLLIDIFWW